MAPYRRARRVTGHHPDRAGPFLNTEGADPGPLLAAATLATVPVLAIYACTARQVTNAFTHADIE